MTKQRNRCLAKDGPRGLLRIAACLKQRQLLFQRLVFVTELLRKRFTTLKLIHQVFGLLGLRLSTSSHFLEPQVIVLSSRDTSCFVLSRLEFLRSTIGDVFFLGSS